MAEIAQYLAFTILIPACVGLMCVALLSVPFAGTHKSSLAINKVVPITAAMALMLAFLWSFVNVVDWAALLRQLPISMPESDAPFERWHGTALVALILFTALPVLGFITPNSPRASTAFGCVAAVATASLVMRVNFPDATPRGQMLIAVSTFFACLLILFCRLYLSLAVATILFATQSVLLIVDQFWLLALMCGACAACGAAILMALIILRWQSRRAKNSRLSAAAGAWEISQYGSPAFAIGVGALGGTVTSCASGYSTGLVPAWSWIAALLIVPAGGAALSLFVRKLARKENQ